MTNTMRVASSVEALDYAEPVEVGELQIDYGIDYGSQDDTSVAVQINSGVTEAFQVLRVHTRALNKLMKQFFPHSAMTHGYRIVNKRGRNKLVSDLKSVN